MDDSTTTVFLSGGITSFEMAWRLKQSGAPLSLVFADTKAEDSDTYRFLDDAERVLGVKVHRDSDGRSLWDLFNDEGMIAGPRAAFCSRMLKFNVCLAWMKANNPSGTVAIGLDWTEPHRFEGVRARWKRHGFNVVFPLNEPPRLMKSDYMANARALGVEPPRLYALGFEHNNCGGACVMGGQGQWAKLLAALPETYAFHEQREREFRERTGKDVAILRDRRGGVTRPLTLEENRKRIEDGQRPQDDLFSCHCFTGDEHE